MEYKVVTADSVLHLESQVNKLLSGGWMLVGGVSVGMGKEWDTYCQAMTKNPPAKLYHETLLS